MRKLDVKETKVTSWEGGGRGNDESQIKIKEMKFVIKVLSKTARKRTRSTITQNVCKAPNNLTVQ